MNFDKQAHLSSKQKKIFMAIALLGFALFTTAICFIIGKPMIQFVDEPQRFRDWVDMSGIWGRIVFLGMVIVQVVLAIIPGEPLELVAGYAFGAIEGTVLCMVGIVIGSMLVFALVRTIGIRIVEVFFSIDKIRSLKFLQKKERLNAITFLIMFIPGTPKDFISYFVGLTDMKWQVWFFISLFARIPSIITSTVIGSEISVKNYISAFIVFGVTLLISGAGVLIYRLILAKKNKRIEEDKKICMSIYSQSFDENPEFAEKLFDEFFQYAEYSKENGNIVCMLFKIPCRLSIAKKTIKAYYLYGVVTDVAERGKGYMKQLFKRAVNSKDFYFVKPINDNAKKFYEKLDFRVLTAFKEKVCDMKIEVSAAQKELAIMRDDTSDKYEIMYRWDREITDISFDYPLS